MFAFTEMSLHLYLTVLAKSKGLADDLKLGTPFEPKKVYDILAVLKSTLSEKVSVKRQVVWCRIQENPGFQNAPGDFGGNAHRRTRWHSMQSFRNTVK